jgi:hypothetical protein
MKVIKFAPDLVPLILSGEKTSTWRLFDDKALRAGDIVEFCNKQTLKKFADAKLVQVIEKPLGELDEEDKRGHEIFINDEEMYSIYSGYYHYTVDRKTLVKVIHFKLLQ